MMTPDRFAALVAAHGADPARWPAAERGAALALLDASAAARSVAARERALEAALAALPPPVPPSAALAARLGALAPDNDLRGLWREIAALFGGWRLAGTALAACAVAGVLLGATLPVDGGGGLGADPAAAEPSLLTYAILTDSYLDH
ncbi:hypothetical protein [Caenispirillum bisanense]|uniref:hypothetical protein n=1 Tax=Caenispirillum bisanense TaxID=414052 RepID=UPI0031D9A93D